MYIWKISLSIIRAYNFLMKASSSSHVCFYGFRYNESTSLLISSWHRNLFSAKALSGVTPEIWLPGSLSRATRTAFLRSACFFRVLTNTRKQVLVEFVSFLQGKIQFLFCHVERFAVILIIHINELNHFQPYQFSIDHNRKGTNEFVCKVSANRTQSQRKSAFSLALLRMPPDLGVAKVCKSDTKPLVIFAFSLALLRCRLQDVAKVCKSNTKPFVNSHFLWLC